MGTQEQPTYPDIQCWQEEERILHGGGAQRHTMVKARLGSAVLARGAVLWSESSEEHSVLDAKNPREVTGEAKLGEFPLLSQSWAANGALDLLSIAIGTLGMRS